jgi:hypothetical protein
VSALEKPEEFLIAAGIMGFDLTDDQIAEIEALSAERKENAAAIQENMKPKEESVEPKEELPEKEDNGELPVTEKRLATWRRFTLKRGKESVSKFDTNGIPEDVIKSVLARVEASTNEDELKSAFDSESIQKGQPDSSSVIEAMRIEMMAMKSQPTQPGNTTVVVDTTGKAVETSTKGTADIVNAVQAMADRLDKKIIIPAPQVTVNVPEQPIPQVTINIPEQAVPQVTVNVPDQKPPSVQVKIPRVKKEKQVIKRDSGGLMTGTESEYEYE